MRGKLLQETAGEKGKYKLISASIIHIVKRQHPLPEMRQRVFLSKGQGDSAKDFFHYYSVEGVAPVNGEMGRLV